MRSEHLASELHAPRAAKHWHWRAFAALTCPARFRSRPEARAGRLAGPSRRAAAAVELAIVTPILLTMLFGIIEYGWIFTVRQGLVTAAREAARTAALPGSSVAEVESRVAEYMQPLGLTTYQTDIETDENGNPTGTVKVSIPYADVTLVACYFGSVPDGNLEASCTMRKEGID